MQKIFSIILVLFPLLFGFAVKAKSKVDFYNVEGERTCVLPPDIPVEVLGESSDFQNYIKVRLPSRYQRECGRTGMVKRTISRPNARPREEREYPFGDYEVAELSEKNVKDWSLDFLHQSSRRTKQRSEVGETENNPVEDLEASGGEVCTQCEKRRRRSEPTDWGSETLARASSPRCEAKGYEQAGTRSLRGASLERIIDDYSEKAQGAIRRGFLSLVPPEGTYEYEKIRKLTDNFQDFDSVDPMKLRALLRKSGRDCYKFVKAALSNDYSRMQYYNRSRWGRGSRARANTDLVKKFCGSEVGDLTEAHWTNAAVGAGTAGPQLEKRGFINLMNPRFGVSSKYADEASAPEGAVLVYKCASHGRILSSSNCYGDISIKTKTGYLRDFFTPFEITRSRRRVLVGIYIKPGGPE